MAGIATLPLRDAHQEGPGIGGIGQPDPGGARRRWADPRASRGERQRAVQAVPGHRTRAGKRHGQDDREGCSGAASVGLGSCRTGSGLSQIAIPGPLAPRLSGKTLDYGAVCRRLSLAIVVGLRLKSCGEETQGGRAHRNEEGRNVEGSKNRHATRFVDVSSPGGCRTAHYRRASR